MRGMNSREGHQAWLDRVIKDIIANNCDSNAESAEPDFKDTCEEYRVIRFVQEFERETDKEKESPAERIVRFVEDNSPETKRRKVIRHHEDAEDDRVESDVIRQIPPPDSLFHLYEPISPPSSPSNIQFPEPASPATRDKSPESDFPQSPEIRIEFVDADLDETIQLFSSEDEEDQREEEEWIRLNK